MGAPDPENSRFSRAFCAQRVFLATRSLLKNKETSCKCKEKLIRTPPESCNCSPPKIKHKNFMRVVILKAWYCKHWSYWETKFHPVWVLGRVVLSLWVCQTPAQYWTESCARGSRDSIQHWGWGPAKGWWKFHENNFDHPTPYISNKSCSRICHKMRGRIA